jgi:energy-coupling factor transporter ATP-binding protein EcfA2
VIDSIKLKFGSADGQSQVQLEVAPVTVFVGPNNAGKSKVLQEINKRCTDGVPHPSDVILESVTYRGFAQDQIPEVRKGLTLRPGSNEAIQPGHIIIGKHFHRLQVSKTQFESALQNPNNDAKRFCPWYLAMHTLMLDGKSRITLVNEQPATDLQRPPQNFLDILFRDDEKRLEVRRIAREAFDNYFVVDPTNLGKLRIRYSTVEPENHVQERGIHQEAVKFHGNSLNIADASDGVKAFTGIVTQIIAGDPSVILIDEPEAFLHPALSFKLGKEVALSAASFDKRLFVSTHSANFVMGCIQSGAHTNIIRLTYLHGVPTARTLPKDKLLRLMRNPLLRSTGVLEGLFYESVIVTESDSDRAFYQEINERLLRSDPGKGIPNCLFLNAQNKQTIRQIVRPLRELGIPAAGIVDVDILKDGGRVWTDFLNSGFIPDVSHNGLGQIRSAIRKKCDESGKNMKRDGGLEILDPNDKEAAENLFGQLGEYGLFVVRSGELESWLKELGATGHGPNWLIDVFERMGEDPEKDDYITPSQGDVWEFIEQIGKWLKTPTRKGIPT